MPTGKVIFRNGSSEMPWQHQEVVESEIEDLLSGRIGIRVPGVKDPNLSSLTSPIHNFLGGDPAVLDDDDSFRRSAQRSNPPTRGNGVVDEATKDGSVVLHPCGEFLATFETRHAKGMPSSPGSLRNGWPIGGCRCSL